MDSGWQLVKAVAGSNDYPRRKKIEPHAEACDESVFAAGVYRVERVIVPGSGRCSKKVSSLLTDC
jgi:hypothetical protein